MKVKPALKLGLKSTPASIFLVTILILAGVFNSSAASPPPEKAGLGANAPNASGLPDAAAAAIAAAQIETPRIRLASGEFDPLVASGPDGLPSALQLPAYPGDGSGYYLVQFRGPVGRSDVDALTATGVKVFDYIPDFAFIVKMDQTIRVAVEQLKQVRWVGLYQPAYRLQADLLIYASDDGSVPETPQPGDGRQVIDREALGDDTPIDVVVSVFRGEKLAPITARIKDLGGVLLDSSRTQWKSKLQVSISPSHLAELAAIPGVRWIEPAPEWKLANNEAADILAVREVWDTHNLYGAGQTIAVCDTGLDQGSVSPGSLHDDFEDGSGGSRVVAIHDRVGDGADDVNSGHGTHVAGSVLGNGDLSGATPGTHDYPSAAYVGMAPEASLVFQAVEDNSSGSLSGIPLNLNTLFSQAAGSGATLHSNSWGSAMKGAYTSSSEDVDEYVWDHPDFTILFAAGNEGIDNNADGVVDLYSMNSPSTAKNCITVGASENDRSSGGYNPGGACSAWGNCWPTDYPSNPIRDDRLSDDPTGLAAFSSRGPTLDGRFKPDIVAPGTNIASVRSSAASSSGWGAINSNYMYMGGTSMATPLVAGAAALVRDFYTDWESITPSAALVKATLINGATDISPGQYGTGSDQEIPDPPRPNHVEGWGRVSVENAIFPASPRELFYFDEATGLNTGGDALYRVQVLDSSEPLRVTLAWSDYPGSPAAAGGLVNDLDLSVTGPGGTTLYPNNADQRGATQHLQYNSDPVWVTQLSSGQGAAVRFTPTLTPAQLDKALFFVYASSYPTSFTCNVRDDDGSGGAPGTLLSSQSVTARGGGWLVVDISGVTISSGSFYIEMRVSGSNPRIVSDNDGMTSDRSWYYDGSSWDAWPYDEDILIQAVMVGSDHSTSFDRVNNVVGVDLNSPATGIYTITVQGYNVPHGPQPFALVASGAITQPNNPPAITGLPDQSLLTNTSLDDAIDLWAFTSDESGDDQLTFSIDNSPDPGAGVSIDANRYVDISPALDWTGQTTVTIRAADPEGLSATDSFLVKVVRPASFPFCDGFESGDLAPQDGWMTYTTNEGRVQVSSSYPYSGTYGVLLDDDTDDDTYSYAASILTIDLSGQSEVELDFWWREFGDENHSGDGVFISDDNGAHWYQAFSFNGGPSFYRNDVIDIDAAATANGLTLNDHFQIKFQFYDNYSVTSDGYAIDEVCIYAPAIPDIQLSHVSFEETVPVNETVTRTLLISNTGNYDLDFSIWERDRGFQPMASVAVIGFDDQAQPCSFNLTVALRDEYQAQRVIFNGPGGDDGGAIVDECSNFGVSGHSAPNFLAFNSGASLSDGGTPRDPEEITFIGTASLVQINAGSVSDSGQSLSLEAFDGNGSSLGSDSITLGPVLQPLSVTASGIARAVISSPASVLVLDDLVFELESVDVPWLSEDPITGTVPAGSSLPVDVNLDATGLAQGDYVADLILSSNDPDENLITVPVTMHVKAGTPPALSDLPDQSVPMNGSADNAIDLWAFADDAESADSQLIFTIINTPDPNAGVSIDANRYVDINPTLGWTGQTSVTVRVTDPDDLFDTDSFQVQVPPLIPEEFLVFLPTVLRNWPPVPSTPVLNAIDNADGDGNYTVSWNPADRAQTYTLQEDDSAAFSSPETVYAGPNTHWSASGKATGTYYYQVRASNSWGHSGWSNVQVVSTQPPTKLYAVVDASLLQGYPTLNDGSDVTMWVGFDHCSGADITRGLVRFDTSRIPAGASISQAKLYLFLEGSCDIGERTHTVTAYRANVSWSESSVNWNNRPGYAEAYGSVQIPSRTWGWYALDVTNLVRGWVNGSFPNYGLMLRGPESSGNDSARLAFLTRDYTGTTYDPYLSLTYAGVSTSEEDVPTLDGASNPTECDLVTKGVLGLLPGTPDNTALEFVERAVCAPD